MSNVLLKVSEAGRQRVLKEKRKNVHAGVLGIVNHVYGYKDKFFNSFSLGPSPFPMNPPLKDRNKIWYNPYEGPSFLIKREDKDSEPIGHTQVLLAEVMLDSEDRRFPSLTSLTA